MSSVNFEWIDINALSLNIYSMINTNPILYYIIIILFVSSLTVTIYYLLLNLLSIKTYKCCNIKQRNKNKKIINMIQKPKQHLSVINDKDDEIVSNIMNELDCYHQTKGKEFEGIETKQSLSNMISMDKFKSLEQELSNQKLLNHYTELRLIKKEKQCIELQKSEKIGRDKINELMNEISIISKKNSNLMTYCKEKVNECRIEYDKMSKKSFQHLTKNKLLQKELNEFKKKLSINIQFKNECTKLRANLSSFKSTIKDNNKQIENYKKEIKEIKNNYQTQKCRLNENSKHFNKINNELIFYKKENKKLKNEILIKYKDKINELKENNDELLKENKEIKLQIEIFSKQLKQQSFIQEQIIDIQQQLNHNPIQQLTRNQIDCDQTYLNKS